jgi:hypothetical protein
VSKPPVFITQTLGTILTRASCTALGSGDDLDPGLMDRLEPLGFHLGILVWDGADEVVTPAVLVDLVGCGATTILSTSISVNARRSTVDRSSHASDGSGSSGMAASLVRLLCSLSSRSRAVSISFVTALNVWRSTSLRSCKPPEARRRFALGLRSLGSRLSGTRSRDLASAGGS